MRYVWMCFLLSTSAWAANPDTRPVPPYPVPDHAPKGWYAHMETNMGRILVLLADKQSPQAVAHFAAFANGEMEWSDPITGEKLKQPYYDGALVTRAKGGLLFEAGDKSGAGGFAPAIFVPREASEPVNFSAGFRMGLKKLGGGQISATRFFITASSQSFMTADHACLGSVIEGQDRVFDITAVKTRRTGDPIEDIVFHKIRVFPVGQPDPLQKPIPYYPAPANQPIELLDKGKLRLKDKTERQAPVR